MSDSEKPKPDITALIRNFGNVIAQHITPRAGAWCSFCNQAKPSDFEVIKTTGGVAICDACVAHAADVFAERKKVIL